LNTVKEFLEFIRFKICIFITSIGISGYLLFNSFSVSQLIFTFLSSFFIIAGAYAYNNITDKEEDRINRSSVNPFALSRKGYLIVIGFFSIGFLFSLRLSLWSIFFYVIGIWISFVYSFFKLKRYFLVKNFYTAFGASLVFLLGAGIVSLSSISYYLIFSLFLFIGSMISDLRDYRGDKLNNIRTIPVILGYQTAKKIGLALLGIFSVIILFFDLIVLLPFSLSMIYFLLKNKPTLAHSCEGFSFIALVIWSML